MLVIPMGCDGGIETWPEHPQKDGPWNEVNKSDLEGNCSYNYHMTMDIPGGEVGGVCRLDFFYFLIVYYKDSGHRNDEQQVHP